jgi:hypothetical protein
MTAMELTPEERRKRSQRNYAVAAALLALVILIFAVTVAKIGGNIAARPF